MARHVPALVVGAILTAAANALFWCTRVSDGPSFQGYRQGLRRVECLCNMAAHRGARRDVGRRQDRESVKPLEEARREFAEKIRTTAGLRSDALVRAFASVPREDFVGP